MLELYSTLIDARDTEGEENQRLLSVLSSGSLTYPVQLLFLYIINSSFIIIVCFAHVQLSRASPSPRTARYYFRANGTTVDATGSAAVTVTVPEPNASVTRAITGSSGWWEINAVGDKVLATQGYTMNIASFSRSRPLRKSPQRGVRKN